MPHGSELTSYGICTDLDCIPTFKDSEDRNVWLTLACVAIFFKSLNSSTYFQKDGHPRTDKEVKKGPDLKGIEVLTPGHAKTGAAFVFIRVAQEGYDLKDDDDYEDSEQTDDEDDDEKDEWDDWLRLPWVPMRYRHSVRFVFHFACAVMAERRLFLDRSVKYPIKLRWLKNRLVQDMAEFLGPEASELLNKMLNQMAHRFRTPHLETKTDSMVYESETFVEEPAPPTWTPPDFTEVFDKHISILKRWEVSNRRPLPQWHLLNMCFLCSEFLYLIAARQRHLDREYLWHVIPLHSIHNTIPFRLRNSETVEWISCSGATSVAEALTGQCGPSQPALCAKGEGGVSSCVALKRVLATSPRKLYMLASN